MLLNDFEFSGWKIKPLKSFNKMHHKNQEQNINYINI